MIGRQNQHINNENMIFPADNPCSKLGTGELYQKYSKRRIKARHVGHNMDKIQHNRINPCPFLAIQIDKLIIEISVDSSAGIKRAILQSV